MSLLQAVNKEANTIIRYSRVNAPTLLVVAGICGFVSTIIKTAEVAPKAAEVKKKVDKKLSTDATKKERVVETVKAVAPIYAPVVIMGTASIACVLYSHHISTRRLAAATTAYSLSEQAFKEYREKVVDTIGKNKETAIRDEIAKDHINNTTYDDNAIEASTGTSLFMDSISKQYFRANRDMVNNAWKTFIRRLYCGNENYMSINEWYDLMDYEGIPIKRLDKVGDDIGYNASSNIDIYYSVQLAPNNEPCTVIEYTVPPTYDFRNTFGYWQYA